MGQGSHKAWKFVKQTSTIMWLLNPRFAPGYQFGKKKKGILFILLSILTNIYTQIACIYLEYPWMIHRDQKQEWPPGRATEWLWDGDTGKTFLPPYPEIM